MNALILIGSPRKGGNTHILVDELIKGLAKGGHQAQTLRLYDFDISPCLDCRKCKKDKYLCALKDGMQEIYPLMDQADLIVFATPNYWYGPSAKMKLLIDRMRPYIANQKLKGKKAAMVIPAAEGPSGCGPMVEMLRLSFAYLEMELAGQVLGTAYERGEIKDDQAAMQGAYDLGASLS